MWSGIPLFDVGDGIRLVVYCNNNNIAILGVEGFKVKGNKRIPDMDFIVDFSSSLNEMNFALRAIDASRAIIESMSDSGILMEFVLVRV